MTNAPLLGCLDEKSAGAYLIRPTKQEKKKKKKKRQPTGIDKVATDAAERAMAAQQAIMQGRMQSGDLGGGWNPSDQLIDNNS